MTIIIATAIRALILESSLLLKVTHREAKKYTITNRMKSAYIIPITIPTPVAIPDAIFDVDIYLQAVRRATTINRKMIANVRKIMAARDPYVLNSPTVIMIVNTMAIRNMIVAISELPDVLG